MNHEKREVAVSTTRHLGFKIDLIQKVAAITKKHKSRIIVFFDNFLVAARKKQRISVKSIQKMLGLQIWISTVFRVARQFLTSVCDILRVTSGCGYFYPRKHKALVSRAVQDLTFWRRFVSGTAAASFDFLLARLPVNDNELTSDACTSFGMAGVLHFGQPNSKFPGCQGLFWQMAWTDWEKVIGMSDLSDGKVEINVAEFLALLITCETFTAFCAGKLTYLGLDNTSARSWFERARCPRFPFDRCAQGTHLHMLKQSMKVRTRWIPSAANTLADKVSRQRFPSTSLGTMVAGVRLLKVRPKWRIVLKYI